MPGPSAYVGGEGHHGLMGNTHHAFDYIELGATDLRASRTFYESAIRAVEGDGEVGGLTTLRAPGTAGPLVLLYSSDLDASVGAVERAGGRISSGPYDFPGGRRFTFLDPSGNELGVWSDA